MAYFAVRKERIAGEEYRPGDRVPTVVLNRLKPSVLNALLHLGRLKFEDEPRPTSRKKRSKKNGNQIHR